MAIVGFGAIGTEVAQRPRRSAGRPRRSTHPEHDAAGRRGRRAGRAPRRAGAGGRRRAVRPLHRRDRRPVRRRHVRGDEAGLGVLQRGPRRARRRERAGRRARERHSAPPSSTSRKRSRSRPRARCGTRFPLTCRPTRRPRPERYLEDLYDLFADQLGRCPGRAAPQRRRPRRRLLSPARCAASRRRQPAEHCPGVAARHQVDDALRHVEIGQLRGGGAVADGREVGAEDDLLRPGPAGSP